MKIGFDGSRAFPSTSSGQVNRTGTENYSYQLLLNLAKIDKKNEYIVYLRPHSQTPGVSFLTPGVKRRWPGNFKFKTLNWPRLWTQAGLAKQTFQDNLDVLFIPAHTSPIIHPSGLKTVVTVHDLGAEYLPKMHQLKQTLYLKWITKFQLKTATKLIAVSYATKDDLVKKIGCDPKKIEVVYEGYDKKLFKPVKTDRLVNSLKKFDLVPEEYFLFVGTVQPRKNLERLIKAFSEYVARGPAGSVSHRASSSLCSSGYALFAKRRDGPSSPSPLALDLVIVGGKGWMSEEIYKLPKKLGIEHQVKFLGRVPDKDLPALYSGAIALTFPSLFEGFGLPIIEAQACGCPVLTSNVSSMPEVGGNSVILVDPYDTESIVRGISKLYPSDIRERLVKAGFENIKRFSWEKAARETLRVLEGVKG